MTKFGSRVRGFVVCGVNVSRFACMPVVTLGKGSGFSVYGKGYSLWVRFYGSGLGLRLDVGFRVPG